MEVEKKRSKGGFFNLFDWNGKSRKKLFSSNSESSGRYQIMYIWLCHAYLFYRCFLVDHDRYLHAILTVKDHSKEKRM